VALVMGGLRPGVVASLAGSPLHVVAAGLWVVLWLVVVLAAAKAALTGPAALAAGRSARRLAVMAPALAVLLTLAMTTVRDGIRDFSLQAAGFDLSSFQVATNYFVLGIFLVLVVLALGIVGLLIAIALKAKRPEEVATP
jgi:hypothetical protein